MAQKMAQEVVSPPSCSPADRTQNPAFAFVWVPSADDELLMAQEVVSLKDPMSGQRMQVRRYSCGLIVRFVQELCPPRAWPPLPLRLRGAHAAHSAWQLF